MPILLKVFIIKFILLCYIIFNFVSHIIDFDEKFEKLSIHPKSFIFDHFTVFGKCVKN